MTAQLIPNLDDQRIAEQLALAKQLREQGMTGTGNSGMAGNVYMVGNQYGNLAKSLGGAFAQYMGNQNRQALDAQRQQQYSDYLKQLPSATESREQFGPATPEGGSLPNVEVPKPTRQFQQERNDWALSAPDIPQFGALRQAGLAQALAAPEKQAAAEEAAANRKAQLQLSLEAQKLAGQERAASAKEIAQMRIDAQADLERQRQEGRIFLKSLAASAGGGKDSAELTPEVVDFYADQYLNGDTSWSVGLARSKAGSALINAVKTRAPELAAERGMSGGDLIANRQEMQARGQAVKEFNQGKAGTSVRALNVATEHLDQLGRLGEALGNGDSQAINAAGNAISKWTGGAAPTNFEAVRNVVADEVIKAVIAGGGGVTERQEMAKKISAAQSPAQLKGVINEIHGLMGGQLHGLKQQYESSTKRKDFDTKLTPVAQRALEGASTKESPVVQYGGKSYRLKPGADPKLKSSYEEVK